MALPQQGTETFSSHVMFNIIPLSVLMALPQQGTETSSCSCNLITGTSVNGLTPTGDGNSLDLVPEVIKVFVLMALPQQGTESNFFLEEKEQEIKYEHQ